MSQPRITIEELPALEQLSEAEAARVFGAGRARLGLEALERRELMASGLTASLTSNVLRVEGTDAAEVIHIRRVSNQISVDGVAIQTGGTAQASVAASSVSQVEIRSLGGNDQVWLGDAGQPLALPVSLQDGVAGDTLSTPSRVTSLAVDGGVYQAVGTSDGKLATLHGNGDLYGFAPNSTSRQLLDSGATCLAVTTQGQIAYLQSTGELKTWAGPGNVGVTADRGISRIAQVGGGQIAVLDTTGVMSTWAGPGSSRVTADRNITQIAQLGGGQIAVLNSTGLMYTWAGVGAGVTADRNIAQIAQLGVGQIAALTTSGLMYTWAGAGAGVTADRNISRIAQFGVGQIAVLASSGQGYTWSGVGAGLPAGSGTYQNIAFSLDGTFFKLTGGGVLERRTPNGVQTTISGVSQLVSGPLGVFWLRASSIYNSDGVVNWNGSYQSIAYGPNGTFFKLTTGGVLQRRNVGGSETVMGSGVSQLVSGPLGVFWRQGEAVYNQDGIRNWTTSYSTIVYGANGVLYLLGSNGVLERRDANNAALPNLAGVSQLVSGPLGVFWRQGEAVYNQDGIRNWTTSYSTIVYGANGVLYLLGSNGVLERRDANNAALPNLAGVSQLVSGPLGVFWRQGEAVYNQDGIRNWTTSYSTIVYGANGVLYLLGSNGVLERRDANNAALPNLAGVSQLVSGPLGVFWRQGEAVYNQDGIRNWTTSYSTIVYGANGVLYLLGSNGVLERRDANNAALPNLAGVSQLVSGPLGVFWRQGEAVYNQDGIRNWTTSYSTIVYGANGVLYLLGSNGVLERRDANNAALPNLAGVSQLVSGPLGVFWRQGEAVYNQDGIRNWTTSYSTIVYGANGVLYLLGSNGVLERRDANNAALPNLAGVSQLVADPGAVTAFALAADHAVYVLGGSATWDRQGQAVALVPGPLPGTAFALGADSTVYVLDGSPTWVPQGGGTALVAGPRPGTAFVLGGDGSLYVADGARNYVRQGGGTALVAGPRPGTAFVLGGDGSLYVADGAGNYVRQGGGTALVAGPTPGTAFVLGGDGSLYVADGAGNYVLADRFVDKIGTDSTGQLQVTYTPIGQKWLELRGASGSLGQPTSDEAEVSGVPGGRVAHFQNGDIYSSVQTGVHTVTGDFYQKWYSLRAQGLDLGQPLSNAADADGGGLIQFFERGQIFADPARGIPPSAGMLDQGGLSLTGLVGWVKTVSTFGSKYVYEATMAPILAEAVKANVLDKYVDVGYQPELVNPENDVGAPVYYVNGMMTAHSVAVAEAQALSVRLHRPVYLVYNGTSGNGDLGEVAKDYYWDVWRFQHNATTRAVAGILYNAARYGERVSIVSHSQGNLLVQNALKTMNFLGYDEWDGRNVAWVSTGDPLTEAQRGNVSHDLGRSPDLTTHEDPIDKVRGGVKFLGVLAAIVSAAENGAMAHDFRASYVGLIDNSMLWPKDLPPVSVVQSVGTLAVGTESSVILPPQDPAQAVAVIESSIRPAMVGVLAVEWTEGTGVSWIESGGMSSGQLIYNVLTGVWGVASPPDVR